MPRTSANCVLSFVVCLNLNALFVLSSRQNASQHWHASQHANSLADATMETHHVKDPAPVVNEDRITCLRQDDLDFVKPLKAEHLVRTVIPLSSTDTSDDISLSVDKAWVKNIDLYVKIARKANAQSFTFDIYGNTAKKVGGHHYSDLAAVDFWVSGVDTLIRNSWMEWGAGFAADREQLALGQPGHILMKMHGELVAEIDDETGDYKIKMIESSSKPFELKIDSQWILNKALAKFGGIDKLVLDNLWPAIANAFPTSLAGSFLYLNSDELGMEVNLKVTGGMATADSPLVVTIEKTMLPTVHLDVLPERLLEELTTNFDPVTIAEQQVEALLTKQDIAAMWDENKAVVKATLERYGLDTEWMQEELDIEEIKERLVKAAKEGADAVLLAMQPFIKASELGLTDIFTGIGIKLETDVEWNKLVEEGRMKIQVRAPKDEENLISIPKSFRDAAAAGVGTNANDLIVSPTTDQSKVTQSGFKLANKELNCGRVAMQNLRVRAGGANGTAVKQYKLGGAVKDLKVKLPKSIDLGWSVTWDQADIEIKTDGTIVVGADDTGIVVKQEPKTGPPAQPTPAGKLRTAADTAIDGQLPAEYLRPTDVKAAMSLPNMVPKTNLALVLNLEGEGNRLELGVSLSGSLSVDLRDILAPILAARPTTDFGYTFFSNMMIRRVTNPEDDIQKYVGQYMAVVVSCGYLRVMDPRKAMYPSTSDPFGVINFKVAETGQLQIDLTKYIVANQYTPPEKVAGTDDSEKCVSLYTNGQEGRKSGGYWSGYKDVSEFLCGPEEVVDRLITAITMQLNRWESDPKKTVEWNYGTHPMMSADGKDKIAQYVLPPGQQTRPLDTIISVAFVNNGE